MCGVQVHIATGAAQAARIFGLQMPVTGLLDRVEPVVAVVVAAGVQQVHFHVVACATGESALLAGQVPTMMSVAFGHATHSAEIPQSVAALKMIQSSGSALAVLLAEQVICGWR